MNISVPCGAVTLVLRAGQDQAGSVPVANLDVQVGDKVVGAFAFAPVLVPVILLTRSCGEVWAFKSPAETMSDLQLAAKEGLRRSLESLSVIRQDQDVFFGVRALAGVDQASLEIELHLALSVLAEPDAITASHSLRASLRGAASHAGHALHYDLTVTISATGQTQLTPHFSLPAFTFALPTIDWNFSFAALSFKGLANPLRLDLPLPTFLGAEPPLRVTGLEAAAFAISLSAEGLLLVTTGAPVSGRLEIRQGPADWEALVDFRALQLTLDNNGPTIAGQIIAANKSFETKLPTDTWGEQSPTPLTLRIREGALGFEASGGYDLGAATGALTVTASLNIAAAELRAKEDPSLVLALGAVYSLTLTLTPAASSLSPSLTELRIVEPWPIALIGEALQGAAAVARETISLLAVLSLARPGAPPVPNLTDLLSRLGRFVEASIRWLARQAGGAGRALAGAAEAGAAFLANILALLRQSADAALDHVAIEIRIDARTGRLRQILITPAIGANPSAVDMKLELLGLRLQIPTQWRPGLLIDLAQTPRAALVLAPDGAIASMPDDFKSGIRVDTDLWMKRDAAPVEAVRDQSAADGARPGERLIRLDARLKAASSMIGLVTLEDGKARFFREIGAQVVHRVSVGADTRSLALLRDAPVWRDLDLNALEVKVTLAADAQERLLPFLKGPSRGEGGSWAQDLSNSISIKPNQAGRLVTGRTVSLPLDVVLHLTPGASAATQLDLSLDLDSLEVRLNAEAPLVISGAQETRDLLGLNAIVLPKVAASPPALTYPQFQLTFADGDVRLGLHPDARLELTYSGLSGAGKDLLFDVGTFMISGQGLDVSATVNADQPVRLAGVDVPFRFRSGALSVKAGRLQSFSLKGDGALPPKLVGDAKVSIEIAMGRNAAGRLEVTGGQAELDKSGDPLVCRALRFNFSIDALGLEFIDFGHNDGYHFYFTLTGSAQFTPGKGEFSNGLLKNLSGLKIEFQKAPLAGDASKLLQAISFQIPIEPPRRTNLFDVFTFELRSIGFQPKSADFGGDPAFYVSGQASLTPHSDIVSANIRFHELKFARPAPGKALPRVRFEGLTVGLALGGMASVEGTAITVDESLPALIQPSPAASNVTASGFLASGRLSIKGWASMSAAMGFLQLQPKDTDEKRHAFFIYVQQDKLSQPIPTPVGTLYQRQVGFGLGFGYTIAAFSAADQVRDVGDLVRVLDGVSRYQGDLSNLRSWTPELEGSRITLALSSLFTMTSASTTASYNEKAEAELPNPVLFDVTAALRSDLTFFLASRAWIAVNYADWWSGDESWKQKPSLRGYIYLSAPRQEFLGRLVSDPEGHIGDHPPLPEPLKKALQQSRFSSTLYIRPGLFHQEFGWPYELGFELGSPDKSFYAKCSGGLILRLEDGAILQGLAFRAEGFATFGGQTGGRSFGASAVARADFTLQTKLIAFISLTDASQTLFYGAMSLDVSVAFTIRVWLSLRFFRREIRLEARFSLALTISIALEIAATTRGLAGRGAASVSVAAFGRSLRIGVSFGFNEQVLTSARARVERFLSLGLAQTLPDPQAGLSTPAPEQPRGPAAVQADQRLADQAERQDLSERTAQDTPPVSPVGQPLHAADFWAFIAPIAGDKAYVMTFLPRDNSLLSPEGGLGTPAGAGGFFAPPNVLFDEAPITAAHALRLKPGPGAAPITLHQLLSNGGTAPFTLTAAQESLAYVDWSAVLAGEGADQLRLSDYIAECFVRAPGGRLQEPKPLRQRHAAELLPQDPAQAAEVLAAAARDQLELGEELAQSLEIDERRSAIIAELGEDLSRLAQAVQWDGSAAAPVTPMRPAVGIDLRDFGLTFLVTEDDLAILFNDRAAKFDLLSRVGEGGLAAGAVELFNPVSSLFKNQKPVLDRPTFKASTQGVALDWDLQAPWLAASCDPEFHLKHYRIERVITDEQRVLNQLPARRTTAKAAAPSRLDVKDAALQWVRLRPKAQYIDDFSDLSDSDRLALLDADATRLDHWNNSSFASAQRVKLLYTITPIDTAGTPGAATPLVFVITRPAAVALALQHATASFEYGEVYDAAPRISLGFDDPNPDKGLGAASLAQERFYELKVRRERASPIGLYGSDAVTDARARPTAADLASDLPGYDRTFVLKAVLQDGHWPTKAGQRSELSILDAAPAAGRSGLVLQQDSLNDLRAWLGIGVKTNTSEPIPARLAVRRRTTAGAEAQPPPAVPWAIVDMLIKIGDAREDATTATSGPQPVAMPTDVFEHPIKVETLAHAFEDLEGRSGRLLLLHPAPEANLNQFLKTPEAATTLLRDPQRRVASLVRWAAQPVSGNDRRLPQFIAGYDVFQVDVHGLPADWGGTDEDAQAQKLQRLARPIAQVQLASQEAVRLDPAEVADFGKVQAFYPSETRRLATTVKPAGARRASWFSAADSLAIFPAACLRRSLCLAPDETQITALFQVRSPDALEITIQGLAGARATLATDQGAPRDILQVGEVFTAAKPGERLTPSQVRRILRGLVLSGANDQAALADNATVEINLKVVARRKAQITATLDIPVRLTCDRHPVLEDVIDLLRYAVSDGDQEIIDFGLGETSPVAWRRYEPVLEAPPQTDAKSMPEFIDAAPPARDPYGWSALRVLGLAVGLRLFDTAQGVYEPSRSALNRIAKAFDLALARYVGAPALGAPYVDILTRDGDLAEVASFDGGQPGHGPLAKSVRDDRALALIQIALRPIVDRLAGVTPAVSYWRANGPGVLNGPPEGLAEALVFDQTGAKGILHLLSPLGDPMAEGAATLQHLRLEPQQTVLIRVTSRLADARPGQDGLKLEPVSAPSCLRSDGGRDPFGAFPELTLSRLMMLAQVDGPVTRAHANLEHWARRRFSDNWPTQPQDVLAFKAKLPAWWARFIEHGPGQAIDRQVGFSLSVLERGQPHRVAPDGRGTLELMVLHDDRYDRLRRFAVQAYGRYVNLEKARNPDKPEPRQLQLTGQQLRALRPFVDIATPRSAPIAPPVILSALRLDPVDEADAHPLGEVLELVMARHTEELLMEANRGLEGALGFEHTAVGFWREFTAAQWAKKLNWEALDLTAGFGDGRLVDDPQALGLGFAPAAPFTDLAKRAPQGWRGVSAMRLRGLPFFFRTHVLAYASAGVVVSKPATATFEEGGYELRAPWRDDAPASEKCPPPRWAVLVDPDDPSAPVSVVFTLPLVRFVDEMTAAQRAAWLPKDRFEQGPAVFAVPDPAARYDICLRTSLTTEAGTRVLSVSGEITLEADQRPEETAAFSFKVIGPRFAATSGNAWPYRMDHADQWPQWFASAAVQVQGAVGVGALPHWTPPATPNGLLDDPGFFLPAAAVADDSPWRILAPSAPLTLTVLRPSLDAAGPDWDGFAAEVRDWRALLTPYDASATRIYALAETLDGIVDLAGWRAKFADQARVTADVGPVIAGLPRLLDTRWITLDRAGSWAWPQPAATRLRSSSLPSERRQLAGALSASGAADVQAQLIVPLMATLERFSRDWGRAMDAGAWGLNSAAAESGAEPDQTARSLGAAHLAIAPSLRLAAAEVQAAGLPKGVDLIVPVRLVAVNRDTAALSVLAEVFEDSFGCSEALSALEQFFAGQEPAKLDLRLPQRLIQDPAIVDALKTLAMPGWAIDIEPDALTLWRPPSSAERLLVANALSTPAGNALAPLVRQFRDGADDQLFGPGRRPAVRVSRGLARSLIADVEGG